VPAELERKLRATAQKKFPNDKERQDRYVYGALRETGWKPSREKRKIHRKKKQSRKIRRKCK